ncbi:putative ABC transporter permease [Enterococcus sp. CSURQ0835]|uniref:putative ABC transporter permease n=1 Tax=Enterococcus sp. CSURQ0835 TaxID=2681394 RepID=UPI0013580660|nr:hypothetical protein [Enterococcus sp. CSURQ0835]
MEETFSRIVLLFFCYAFIGWVWETIYCSLKARHFVYRGFLLGPITPIYGFGVLGVLYLIEPYQNNLALLFLLALLLVTTLEYVTSFLLEKLFHLTLWDYKKVPLNINGRVAVPVSIFWGVACVFIVKIINPELVAWVYAKVARFGIFLPLILLMLMSFDLGFTLANVASLRRRMAELSQTIESRKQKVRLDLATHAERLEQLKARQKARLDWLNDLKEHPEITKNLPQLNFQERRFLNGFPNMKTKEIKGSLDDVRALVKELRGEKK